MRRRLIAVVFGMFAAAVAAWAADTTIVRVKAVDARRGVLTVTLADGRDREYRLDRQSKVLDADGREVNALTRAVALQPGAAVLVELRADGASVLAVRLVSSGGDRKDSRPGDATGREKIRARPGEDQREKGRRETAGIKGKRPLTAEQYAAVLPRLGEAQKRQLDQDLRALKAVSDQHRAAVEKVQKQLNLDPQAVLAEFRAAAAPTANGRGASAEQIRRFSAKYEPKFQELIRTAAIDPSAESKRLAASLKLSPAALGDLRTISLTQGHGNPNNSGSGRSAAQGPPQPPADVAERTFAAPFTTSGHIGRDCHEDTRTGRLDFFVNNIFAASDHRTSFILQDLPVEAGVRRVRVSARLDPVHYHVFTVGFLGYASAEAIVNLRVMDGTEVVASRRQSLGRAVSALVGVGPVEGTIPVELHCDFTRPRPDETGSYSLVAEIEGWAGSGGLAGAIASAEATLRQFHVSLYRR